MFYWHILMIEFGCTWYTVRGMGDEVRTSRTSYRTPRIPMQKSAVHAASCRRHPA